MIDTARPYHTILFDPNNMLLVGISETSSDDSEKKTVTDMVEISADIILHHCFTVISSHKAHIRREAARLFEMCVQADDGIMCLDEKETEEYFNEIRNSTYPLVNAYPEKLLNAYETVVEDGSDNPNDIYVTLTEIGRMRRIVSDKRASYLPKPAYRRPSPSMMAPLVEQMRATRTISDIFEEIRRDHKGITIPPSYATRD